MELIVTIYKQAGPMIWPLFLMGIISIVLFIERFLFLHKGQIKHESFVRGLQNLLWKGRFLEAVTLCQATPGPVANVLKVIIAKHNKDKNQIFAEAQKAAMLELPLLKKYIASIYTIAQTAPLLGLIGTVLSFIGAFSSLKTLGAYANIASLSPFVVSALSTTLIGLCISFFSYISYNLLKGRLKAIIFDLEWSVNELIETIEKQKTCE